MTNNPDAEKSVLATIMQEDQIAVYFEELTDEDFRSDKNKLIFNAAKNLYRQGLPISLKAVSAELQNQGQFESAGASYLSILFDNYFVVDSGHHIKLLKEATVKRRFFEIGNAYIKFSQRQDITASEAIQRATSLFSNLNESYQCHTFPPLSADQTKVKYNLVESPPAPDFVINFRCHGLALVETVGGLIATGGTGKTRLLIQIAAAASSGENCGDFSFPRPLRTLILVGEEPQDELNRRLWSACNGVFHENLHAMSTKGNLGPLMKKSANGVEKTESWTWLDETIRKHRGLDLLIIDPKSRFYGLDENSNDDNTQWVSCLEEIAGRHSITIIFAHHTPKDTKELSQWMARGGGGLVDACRFAIGMMPCSKSEGEQFNIEWPSHIKLRVVKNNYAPKNGKDSYMRFNDSGNLEKVYLRNDRIDRMKYHFHHLLQKYGQELSRRELVKGGGGKEIFDNMDAAFKNENIVRSKDINTLLDALLQDGSICEVKKKSGRNTYTVFKTN